MPSHQKTASTANADKRLSQLIKLKRMEKPDPAFWDKFDQEFRNRQLTTFVQIQPLHIRLRRVCLIVARKAAPPVAAAGAVALTFFAVTSTSFLTSSDSSEQSPAKTRVSQAPQRETEAAYFTVQTELKPAAEKARSFEQTIYQVNVLDNGSDKTSDYKLYATPVTFSQSGNTQSQGAGAQVLSRRADY